MGEADWSGGALLDALDGALDEGFVAYDHALACRHLGRRVHELFGVDPAWALGRSRAEVVRRMAEATDAPDALVASVGAPGGEDRTVADPIEIQRPRARTVVWTSVPLGPPHHAWGRLDVIRDVTRERRAELAQAALERELEESTLVDRSTGLPNRRRVEQEVDREHRRAQRAWDSYALVRLWTAAVDETAGTLGRAAADELARQIGEELRAGRREYDVVGRWDDGEFLVLLPRSDAHATQTVVGRIFAAVRDHAFTVPGAGAPQRIAASAGVAVWIPPSGDVAADVLRRSAVALDAARGAGPGHVHFDIGPGTWKEEP